MERFNYRKLKDVFKEDAAILMYLEAESYGDKQDQKEELDAMKHRFSQQGG